MDRTLVSLNVPNFLTINLMAWLGFLLVVLVFQLIYGRKGRPAAASGSNGGGTEIADLGY